MLLVLVEGQAQAQSSLTRHLRPDAVRSQAPFLNPLPATQSLRLDVVLPLRDRPDLDAFLRDVVDPASPNYRHFLSVSEFTDRFGPSREDYDALTRYLTDSGLRVVGGSRDGMDVQVEGPVQAVETAFRVRMGVYHHPFEERTFYAPDREPTVALPFPLWHVSGLDDYSIPKPLFRRRSDLPEAGGSHPQPLASTAPTGSGPSGSFLGSDMRAAYYGGTALTGAGQTLGLFEFYGTDLSDLNAYFKNIGQTNNVPIALLSTDGTSTACVYSNGKRGCDDTEQTLDMTQALGMAPGLAGLVLFIGSTDTAILSAITTHNPLPTTIGCSWGWTPPDPTADDPYWQRMAAQGQTFFVASGDDSTWTAKGGAAAWPADDAYVVSVGGTGLVTAGPAGAWSSETAWASSGGGVSPDKIDIPSWQQLAGVVTSANKASDKLRNGPDVAAHADYTFYTCGNQTACTANQFGGTSFAAPMWAGLIALANQAAAANKNAPLGFLNPAIYALATGSNYSATFHDITSGTTRTYSAVKGYDLVTGWGSPNGAALINALAGLPTSANFTLSAAPTSMAVNAGTPGTSTISTFVSAGFNSTISLSASGQPSGVTIAFKPASIVGAGTSTMTLTVASSAPAGTYPITVTATGGGITHTATVSLTVGASVFTVSASPASVTAAARKNTTTIATTVSGTFNAAIDLTASGLPTGVTVAFKPKSIAAPGAGTSTMTFTVAATTAPGTYPITVTATGGGLTNTATVSLTVSGKK
jgi:kumamolisin